MGHFHPSGIRNIYINAVIGVSIISVIIKSIEMNYGIAIGTYLYHILMTQYRWTQKLL